MATKKAAYATTTRVDKKATTADLDKESTATFMKTVLGIDPNAAATIAANEGNQKAPPHAWVNNGLSIYPDSDPRCNSDGDDGDGNSTDDGSRRATPPLVPGLKKKIYDVTATASGSSAASSSWSNSDLQQCMRKAIVEDGRGMFHTLFGDNETVRTAHATAQHVLRESVHAPWVGHPLLDALVRTAETGSEIYLTARDVRYQMEVIVQRYLASSPQVQEKESHATRSHLPASVFVESQTPDINSHPIKHCWKSILKRVEHLVHRSAADGSFAAHICDVDVMKEWNECTQELRQKGTLTLEHNYPVVPPTTLDRVFPTMRTVHLLCADDEYTSGDRRRRTDDDDDDGDDDDGDNDDGQEQYDTEDSDGEDAANAWLRDFCAAIVRSGSGEAVPSGTTPCDDEDASKRRLAQVRLGGSIDDWIAIIRDLYYYSMSFEAPASNWLAYGMWCLRHIVEFLRPFYNKSEHTLTPVINRWIDSKCAPSNADEFFQQLFWSQNRGERMGGHVLAWLFPFESGVSLAWKQPTVVERQDDPTSMLHQATVDALCRHTNPVLVDTFLRLNARGVSKRAFTLEQVEMPVCVYTTRVVLSMRLYHGWVGTHVHPRAPGLMVPVRASTFVVEAVKPTQCETPDLVRLLVPCMVGNPGCEIIQDGRHQLSTNESIAFKFGYQKTLVGIDQRYIESDSTDGYRETQASVQLSDHSLRVANHRALLSMYLGIGASKSVDAWVKEKSPTAPVPKAQHQQQQEKKPESKRKKKKKKKTNGKSSKGKGKPQTAQSQSMRAKEKKREESKCNSGASSDSGESGDPIDDKEATNVPDCIDAKMQQKKEKKEQQEEEEVKKKKEKEQQEEEVKKKKEKEQQEEEEVKKKEKEQQEEEEVKKKNTKAAAERERECKAKAAEEKERKRKEAEKADEEARERKVEEEKKRKTEERQRKVGEEAAERKRKAKEKEAARQRKWAEERKRKTREEEAARQRKWVEERKRKAEEQTKRNADHKHRDLERSQNEIDRQQEQAVVRAENEWQEVRRSRPKSHQKRAEVQQPQARSRHQWKRRATRRTKPKPIPVVPATRPPSMSVQKEEEEEEKEEEVAAAVPKKALVEESVDADGAAVDPAWEESTNDDDDDDDCNDDDAADEVERTKANEKNEGEEEENATKDKETGGNHKWAMVLRNTPFTCDWISSTSAALASGSGLDFVRTRPFCMHHRCPAHRTSIDTYNYEHFARAVDGKVHVDTAYGFFLTHTEVMLGCTISGCPYSQPIVPHPTGVLSSSTEEYVRQLGTAVYEKLGGGICTACGTTHGATGDDRNMVTYAIPLGVSDSGRVTIRVFWAFDDACVQLLADNVRVHCAPGADVSFDAFGNVIPVMGTATTLQPMVRLSVSDGTNDRHATIKDGSVVSEQYSMVPICDKHVSESYLGMWFDYLPLSSSPQEEQRVQVEEQEEEEEEVMFAEAPAAVVATYEQVQEEEAQAQVHPDVEQHPQPLQQSHSYQEQTPHQHHQYYQFQQQQQHQQYSPAPMNSMPPQGQQQQQQQQQQMYYPPAPYSMDDGPMPMVFTYLQDAGGKVHVVPVFAPTYVPQQQQQQQYYTAYAPAAE